MLARSHGYSAGSWSTHHAYHADSVGNISALVSTAQTVSASYRYDPFGRTIALCGTMAGQNTYRFSSKMFTGGDLYYYGYRFYDPNYQRWINQDPIGESGGINLYGFVENEPINAVDPEGLRRVPQRRTPGGGGGGGRGQVFRIPWNKPGRPGDAVAAQCRPSQDLNNARRRAVDRAWQQERDMVRREGRGTRDWTAAERAELLARGRVSGYHGHHINNAAMYPELAGNPNNIVFRTPREHFGEHNQNWQNPTSGPLINRCAQ
jgi:RHS repeat-associated protein